MVMVWLLILNLELLNNVPKLYRKQDYMFIQNQSIITQPQEVDIHAFVTVQIQCSPKACNTYLKLKNQ